MRKEKEGKRGKKKMDERQEEREKEGGEVEERMEERTEEGTEEGTQEIEERLEFTEEACEEEERCEEDSDSHSAAKRARVCATFTDSQETTIVEFVKEHPELYEKTRYGKLFKLQSGQAPREMTKRQSWVYQQMGFRKTHIRRKGASRSSGFEASPNTIKQDESRGSTTDTEYLESSVLRESRSQPMFTSTPVSTDCKLLEHFRQAALL